MPLPEILYDYALMMLFNERDENQTRDLSREYLGYIRVLDPARFAGFSNLETDPMHLGTPYLPVTQAQAMVALATYLQFPTLARELREQFPNLVPLESGATGVVAKIIIGVYSQSSITSLRARWERFRTYLQQAREQDAAGFRTYLVPAAQRADFETINETLTTLEKSISGYATTMGVDAPLLVAKFKIDPLEIQEEIAKASFPGNINDCLKKIAPLICAADALMHKSQTDGRYATQALRVALMIRALLVHGGHILFTLLRDIPKASGTADYRPIFKGRLEKLARFMQIDAEELSPFATDYKSANQTTLDAHHIETDSLSVSVGEKELEIVCNCCMNVMDNPVKLPSGHYIELNFLKRLFAGALSAEDPYSRAPIKRDIMVIDMEMKAAIDAAVETAVKPETKKANRPI